MQRKVERIKSGIPGLDEMMEGGFVKGHDILISGSCGTGKSTFCLQYLVYGAMHGENGVYVSFEESPKQIEEEGEVYGWDITKLEREKRLRVIRIEPTDILKLLEEGYSEVESALEALSAQRMVIDSISTFDLVSKTDYERRKGLLDFVSWLKKHKCTTLMTVEMEPGTELYSRFGLAEFASDAVIALYYAQERDRRRRMLEIVKMRETKHLDRMVSFDITKKGIVVNPKALVYSPTKSQVYR